MKDEFHDLFESASTLTFPSRRSLFEGFAPFLATSHESDCETDSDGGRKGKQAVEAICRHGVRNVHIDLSKWHRHRATSTIFVIHFGSFETPAQTNNKVGGAFARWVQVRKLDSQLAKQPSELKSFSYDKVWEYRYIDVFSLH
jgi:hypothetical protein